MVRRSPAPEEALDPFGRLARRAGRPMDGGRAARHRASWPDGHETLTAEAEAAAQWRAGGGEDRGAEDHGEGDSWGSESWGQDAWPEDRWDEALDDEALGDEALVDDREPPDLQIPAGRAVVSPEARSDGREVLEARALVAGTRNRVPGASSEVGSVAGSHVGPGSDPGARGLGAPPAWFRVPSALRGASWSPAWTAVLAVVLAVAIAIGVFAVRVALAQAHARPEPVSTGVPSGVSRTAVPSAFASGAAGAAAGAIAGATGGATGAPSGAGTGGPAGAAPAAALVVDVVGEVARPGIVKLAKGSRVVDAVRAAGGPTTKAELSVVNQARPVVDGEQIVVPRVGAVPSAGSVPGSVGLGGSGSASGAASGGGSGSGGGSAGGGTSGTGSTGSGGAAAGGAASGGGAGGGSVIDLNTADVAVLDSLPGVGPAIAQRILDWRTLHGRFTSVDELGEVSGIGPKIIERLRPLVRVG